MQHAEQLAGIKSEQESLANMATAATAGAARQQRPAPASPASTAAPTTLLLSTAQGSTIRAVVGNTAAGTQAATQGPTLAELKQGLPLIWQGMGPRAQLLRLAASALLDAPSHTLTNSQLGSVFNKQGAEAWKLLRSMPASGEDASPPADQTAAAPAAAPSPYPKPGSVAAVLAAAAAGSLDNMSKLSAQFASSLDAAGQPAFVSKARIDMSDPAHHREVALGTDQLRSAFSALEHEPPDDASPDHTSADSLDEDAPAAGSTAGALPGSTSGGADAGPKQRLTIPKLLASDDHFRQRSTGCSSEGAWSVSLGRLRASYQAATRQLPGSYQAASQTSSHAPAAAPVALEPLAHSGTSRSGSASSQPAQDTSFDPAACPAPAATAQDRIQQLTGGLNLRLVWPGSDPVSRLYRLAAAALLCCPKLTQSDSTLGGTFSSRAADIWPNKDTRFNSATRATVPEYRRRGLPALMAGDDHFKVRRVCLGQNAISLSLPKLRDSLVRGAQRAGIPVPPELHQRPPAASMLPASAQAAGGGDVPAYRQIPTAGEASLAVSRLKALLHLAYPGSEPEPRLRCLAAEALLDAPGHALSTRQVGWVLSKKAPDVWQSRRAAQGSTVTTSWVRPSIYVLLDREHHFGKRIVDVAKGEGEISLLVPELKAHVQRALAAAQRSAEAAGDLEGRQVRPASEGATWANVAMSAPRTAWGKKAEGGPAGEVMEAPQEHQAEEQQAEEQQAGTEALAADSAWAGSDLPGEYDDMPWPEIEDEAEADQSSLAWEANGDATGAAADAEAEAMMAAFAEAEAVSTGWTSPELELPGEDSAAGSAGSTPAGEHYPLQGSFAAGYAGTDGTRTPPTRDFSSTPPATAREAAGVLLGAKHAEAQGAAQVPSTAPQHSMPGALPQHQETAAIPPAPLPAGPVTGPAMMPPYGGPTQPQHMSPQHMVQQMPAQHMQHMQQQAMMMPPHMGPGMLPPGMPPHPAMMMPPPHMQWQAPQAYPTGSQQGQPQPIHPAAGAQHQLQFQQQGPPNQMPAQAGHYLPPHMPPPPHMMMMPQQVPSQMQPQPGPFQHPGMQQMPHSFQHPAMPMPGPWQPMPSGHAMHQAAAPAAMAPPHMPATGYAPAPAPMSSSAPPQQAPQAPPPAQQAPGAQAESAGPAGGAAGAGAGAAGAPAGAGPPPPQRITCVDDAFYAMKAHLEACSEFGLAAGMQGGIVAQLLVSCCG
jgi:hypothetical protein